MFLFPWFLFDGVLFMGNLLSSPILQIRFYFFIGEILIIFLIKIAEMRIIWIFILLYSYFLKFIHKKWKKILFPFEATFWKDLRIYCFYPIFIIKKKVENLENNSFLRFLSWEGISWFVQDWRNFSFHPRRFRHCSPLCE